MNDVIRFYINLVEDAQGYNNPWAQPVLVEENIVDIQSGDTDIRERLTDILVKLRGYSEPTGGVYSEGFEAGLEMAATMVENLINYMGER